VSVGVTSRVHEQIEFIAWQEVWSSVLPQQRYYVQGRIKDYAHYRIRELTRVQLQEQLGGQTYDWGRE